MKIIDAFEHVPCKGEHCSNTLQAFAHFILTCLRGKYFTDKESESRNGYITCLRSHSKKQTWIGSQAAWLQSISCSLPALGKVWVLSWPINSAPDLTPEPGGQSNPQLWGQAGGDNAFPLRSPKPAPPSYSNKCPRKRKTQKKYK